MTIYWLVGVARYCEHYHSGQWSKLYRLGCIAREFLRRDHQITDIYKWYQSKAVSDNYKSKAAEVYFRMIQTKQGQ